MEGQGQKDPFMHGSRHTRPSGQKNPGQHVAAFHRSVPKNPGEQLGLERPYLREASHTEPQTAWIRVGCWMREEEDRMTAAAT